MKKSLLFLCSTLFVILTIGGISTAFAQSDSVRITHSQETGTLEKQRFIDQYDYVFMTKEPTKWMVKGYAIRAVKANSYDLISSDRVNVPIEIAFERKLTPELSINFGGMPQIATARLIKTEPVSAYSGRIRSNLSLKAFAELKWYYNMAQRIKTGINANNFSGNYLSLRVEKNFINTQALFKGYSFSNVNGEFITDKMYEANNYKFGISYGLQRRFLSNGLIDFALSLNRATFIRAHQQIFLKATSSSSPMVESYNWELNKVNFWQLQTDMRLGFAIGDFKRVSKQPLCDVLQCYENVSQLWKIGWPSIRLSPNEQAVSSSIAFEYKLFNSKFSLNAQIDGYFFKQSAHNTLLPFSQQMELWSSLQCRYYMLQRTRLTKYHNGSNLSGLYTAISFFNITDRTTIDIQHFYVNSLELGPTFGFQQKIFNRGYIDYHFSFSKSMSESRNYRRSVAGEFTFRPSFKLGFAL